MMVNSWQKTSGKGFTLVELVAVMVLICFFGLVGIESLRGVVASYLFASNADEVVQKAQMALNRMTIELSYIDPTDVVSNSGTATSITYKAVFTTGEEVHTLSQSGDSIIYRVNGDSYVLINGVAENGFNLRYYVDYNDANSTMVLGKKSTMVEISLAMLAPISRFKIQNKFVTRIMFNKQTAFNYLQS